MIVSYDTIFGSYFCLNYFIKYCKLANNIRKLGSIQAQLHRITGYRISAYQDLFHFSTVDESEPFIETLSGSVKNSVSSLTTLDRLGKGNRHEVKVEYRKV